MGIGITEILKNRKKTKKRDLHLRNRGKQLQSVSKPWIFHSLQVERFQPRTTIAQLLKVTENQTLHVQQATWLGQSTTSHGLFHTDWDEVGCVQSAERGWPLSHVRPFFLTFQIGGNSVSFQNVAIWWILICCCLEHFSVSYEKRKKYFNIDSVFKGGDFSVKLPELKLKHF